MSTRALTFCSIPVSAALVCITIGVSACPATAQPPTSDSYSVTHSFRLTTPGNLPPVVQLRHREQTWAQTNNCIDTHDDRGTVGIGQGVTTMVQTSTAPNSTATAIAEASITVLAAGVVEGAIEARGTVVSDVTGCPAPPPPPIPLRGGLAFASSSSAVRARGQYLDSRGNIRWSGGWRNVGPVAGSTSRGFLRDPVLLKVTDNTTGATNEWTLVSVVSVAGGGETRWEDGVLSNTAVDAVLDVSVGVPGITGQQGRLRLVAAAGVVTESLATGMFAGAALPPVGGPPGFSTPLPEIVVDYDAGANPSNDIVTELTFGGAGRTEANAGALGCVETGSPTVTDLSNGYEDSDTSAPQGTDTGLGFNTQVDSFRLAQRFTVPAGVPAQLTGLMFPIYQTGASPTLPIISAYARIWTGQPGSGGVPIAGDLVTNRMVASRFLDVFRVPASSPLDPNRALKIADLDLRWVPPLAPGQYWIEVATRGQAGFTGPWMPPAVWSHPQDGALAYNVQTGQWAPIQDPGSGRPMSLPLRVFGLSGLFGDNFDCYAPGPLAPQGGWRLWDGGIVSLNGDVNGSLASSAPNSLEAVNGTDLVQTFNVTSGKLRVRAKTYYTSSSTGPGFVIALNTFTWPYTSGGNWSLQVQFNPPTAPGMVQSDNAPPGAATCPGPGTTFLPLIKDQWVELVADIDLEPSANQGCGRLDITYGGQALTTNAPWRGNVSAAATAQLAFQCLDLYSESAGFRWDDVVIEEIGASCYPDCNVDGALTVADFGCFQTKFVAANPYADCNQDGTLTVADFGCFQTKFVAGCP